MVACYISVDTANSWLYEKKATPLSSIGRYI